MKIPSLSTKKLFLMMLSLLPFIIIYILSRIFFKGLYFFEWSSRHYYLHLWLVVLYLIYSERNIIAFSLTIGNILGIVVGQFLGDKIRYLNKLKITESMGASQKYFLHTHPGFKIWSITIIISLLIGIIIHTILKTHKNKIIN